MSETKGVDGVVKVAAAGGSVVDVLHVSSFTLEETTETIDVTSMGDSSREILSTFKAFTGSIDGYWDPADTNLGHGASAPTVQAGTSIDFELYPAGTSGIYYSGSAIVTSISRTASFDGAVEYSISFDGQGDLTYNNAV